VLTQSPLIALSCGVRWSAGIGRSIDRTPVPRIRIFVRGWMMPARGTTSLDPLRGLAPCAFRFRSSGTGRERNSLPAVRTYPLLVC
jgi:hypothetical protein